MNRFVSVVGLLLCFNLSALAARPAARARASDTSTSEAVGISAAALLGVGVGFETPSALGIEAGKPYGFGFGLRGGFTFPVHVYVGTAFQYFFGGSNEYNVLINGVPGRISISTKLFTITAEGGYQFEWGAIRLRPFLGLGIADRSASADIVNGRSLGSDSTVYFAIQPGAVFEFSFSGAAPGPFIGADTHLSFTTGSGTQGMVFLATGGYRF